MHILCQCRQLARPALAVPAWARSRQLRTIQARGAQLDETRGICVSQLRNCAPWRACAIQAAGRSPRPSHAGRCARMGRLASPKDERRWHRKSPAGANWHANRIFVGQSRLRAQIFCRPLPAPRWQPRTPPRLPTKSNRSAQFAPQTEDTESCSRLVQVPLHRSAYEDGTNARGTMRQAIAEQSSQRSARQPLDLRSYVSR